MLLDSASDLIPHDLQVQKPRREIRLRRLTNSLLQRQAGCTPLSIGNLATTASYSFRFSNALVYSAGATASAVHDESKTESGVVVKSEAKDLVYHHRSLKFPLRISYQETDFPNKTPFVRAGIEQAWQEDSQEQSSVGKGRSSFSTLRNSQRSKGELLIPSKGAISGTATTKQKYAYESTDGCYFRSVAASNYT